jgi:quinol-cytochrome oxidoreductase complex cytochrome b subunit
VQRDAFMALLVVLALLLVTGLYLMLEYRPQAAPAFWDANGSEWAWGYRVRIVHRVLAYVALGLGVLVAGFGFTRRHRWALGIPIVLLAASIGGYALPWEQLALWAVTVDSDFSGVLRAAFSDEVRFVLIQDREVSQGAYRTAVLLHLAVVPVLLGVFLFLSRRVSAAGGHHDSTRRNHGGRRHDAGAGPP